MQQLIRRVLPTVSRGFSTKTQTYEEFAKTIQSFNYANYAKFIKKVEETQTEDRQKKTTDLESKLDPATIKKLKAISQYLNRLGSVESEYLFMTHEELLCKRESIHPIALEIDPQQVSAKVGDEVAHPINYFLQIEGMAKMWANRAAMSVGTGGGGQASEAKTEGKGKEQKKEDAPAAPEKKNFDVILKSYDAASKVKIIKEVKELLKLGLKEAKDKVDVVPSKLLEGKPKAEAEALAEKLKALGCQVELS